MSPRMFTLEGLKKSYEIEFDAIKISDKVYKYCTFKPIPPEYETVKVTTTIKNYNTNEKVESEKIMSLIDAFNEIESLRKNKPYKVYRYVRTKDGFTSDYEFKGHKTSAPKKRKNHSSTIKVNVGKMF